MDTSNKLAVDVLGRSNGKRRKHSIAEKRRIVELTLQPGASVSIIARRHDVNANMVFCWRRLYRKGLLDAPTGESDVALVPVEVTLPRVRTKRAYRRAAAKQVSVTAAPDCLEVELAGGNRVRLHGVAATRLLERLIEELCPR